MNTKLFTIDRLREYEEKGLITIRPHFKYPELVICNYTPECQFSRSWDEVTSYCRGLILDLSTNSIVAIPFKKFFNLNEIEEHKKYLNKVPFLVQEKTDGSLGIIFYYKNEWLIATRGSFSSEQAIKATQMLKQYNLNPLENEYTYLVEIVYKENQIVVVYEEEDLYLLSRINKVTGVEDCIDLNLIASQVGFKLPNIYEVENIESLKKIMELTPKSNFEGYVLTYADGMKIKLKYDEYCQLHKVLSGLTTQHIIESIKDNTIANLLEILPDEHYDWVNDLKSDVENLYNEIEMEAKLEYKKLIKLVNDIEDIKERRKVFAMNAKQYTHSILLFSLYDSKDINDNIWNIIILRYKNE